MDDGARLDVFRQALLARRFDERLAQLGAAGELPVGGSGGSGHEVARLAALAALRSDDPVLTGQWGTATSIGRGVPLDVVLCDLSAREGGSGAGRVGVASAVDAERGVLGTSGTPGGDFVVGAGVAFAEAWLGTHRVTLVCFGEGTSNRGQFHEAANFAALRRLPLILFCENDGWSQAVPMWASTSVPRVADRAAGYGMAGVTVDGADATAVHAAVADAADRARAGAGPTLIEALVPRLGAGGPDDGEAPHDTEGEDPLERLRAELAEAGVLDQGRLADVERAAAEAIDEAVAVVRRRAPIDPATLGFARLRPADGLADRAAAADSTPGARAEPAAAETTHGEVMRYAEAIGDGVRHALATDERVVVFGEHVAADGGAGGVLRGLGDEFGERVFDIPVSDHLAVGMGVGMALRGLRPIVELAGADRVFGAGEEVFLTGSAWAFAPGSDGGLPLVVRLPCGGDGASLSTESHLALTPGLEVVVPSTPAAAKGAVGAAVASTRPTLVLEHRRLHGMTGPVPLGEHRLELGRAVVRRPGHHVTVIAWHDMVRRALVAADQLATEGVEVEVVDPVTLRPLDVDTLVASVARTGACVVVEEVPVTGGTGAEIGALLMEHAFGYLDRPLVRLGPPDGPANVVAHLTEALVPTVDEIVAAVRRLVG